MSTTLRTPATYRSPRDIAREYDICEQTVYRWIWSGRLPAHRVGRLLRVSVEDLERFVR